MENLKKIFNTIWDVLEGSTFALAIFAVAYLFLFQPSEVLGMSSYPTVKPHEKVISEKISYKFSSPQRGDFVILRSPENPDVEFIKRVVGLPGETVEIKENKVLINGEPLDEPYVSTNTYGEGKVVVPQNHYFVLGDNREHSSDSREFGTIDKSLIEAKVIFRFWPLDRFGVIE